MHSMTIAAIAVVVASCVTAAGSAVSVPLGENFQLRVGESVVAAGGDIEVGLLAVVSDSRCGRGEVCVWEGDAVIRIWLHGSGTGRVERDLHLAANQVNAADFRGFSVRLVSLFPAAIAGQSIAPENYLVTLQIRQGPATDSTIY